MDDFVGPSPLGGWILRQARCKISAVTIGAADRVHLAGDDGRLYTLDPNGLLLWSYDSNSPLTSPPTVGPDGAVYVGTEDGRLCALDPNGRLRWNLLTDAIIYAAPALGPDGTIYVGSGDYKMYSLYRMNQGRQDRQVKWAFSTGKIGRAHV